MSTKEEWQDTGKAFGGAFKKLAKTSIKSVSVGIQKAEEWANADESEDVNNEGQCQGEKKQKTSTDESNVFNDGTWRETGQKIGEAFKDLGKTIARTAEEGVQAAEKWADGPDKESAADDTITVEAKEL